MTWRILLAESNTEDTLFLRDVLGDLEGREYWSDWVHLETLHAASWEAAETILQESLAASAPVDVLLLDLNLGDAAWEAIPTPSDSRLDSPVDSPPWEPDPRVLQGTEIFRRAKAIAPQTPVVLLVDPQDIELAELLLREGAQDFLVKSQVDCAPLAHAIRNAIERHRYLESVRAAAVTDPLTGLLTRAAFLALAERDRKLALGAPRRILLAVVEPDGMPEGSAAERGRGEQCRDLALVKAAEQLRAVAGPADLVARIGERRFALAGYEGAVDETEEQVGGGPRTRLEAASAGLHWTIGIVECGTAGCGTAGPATLEDLLLQAERQLAPLAVAARR